MERTILMNIINQINEKIITHMTSLGEKINTEQMDFTKVIEDTYKLVHEIGRDMVEEFIQTLEEGLLNSEERKEEWTVHIKGREKTISTKLGDITYSRTYYKERETGTFRHLVDDLLSIEPHTRIDTGLQEDMLKKAKEMSYQKVIDSYEDISIRSRNTIKNLVQNAPMEHSSLKNLEKPVKKKRVAVIHIEADEDHVHQQKGKGLLMKLVYIHEGKEIVDKFSRSKNKRKKLIGAKYLTGLYPKNDEIWFEVLDYLEEHYDLDYAERIFLSGDGASWIRAGEEIIPKCSFVIDGFHLSKYIKSATTAYPGFERKLKRYVYSGNKEWVEGYFDTIEGNEHSKEELKRFAACRRYILGNWDEIQNRHKEGYVECSAEGHVSHMLSHRLSSRPLSWSKKGSENIAKLRVYTSNGGSIRLLLNTRKESTMENKGQVKCNTKIIKNKKKLYEAFSSNVTILDIGKKTNLYKLLKNVRSA